MNYLIIVLVFYSSVMNYIFNGDFMFERSNYDEQFYESCFDL